MPHYDLIVLGTGGVGSAALFHAAKRNLKVLGIDRYPPAHSQGSSHGESRIIRMSYFEHPDYVPLLRRSYELWQELGDLEDAYLFHKVGLVYAATPNCPIISGVTASAERHGLWLRSLTPGLAEEIFPGLAIPSDYAVYFEENAGYLLVEKCVQVHLSQAQRLGAECIHGETVTKWEATSTGVVVETETAKYEADRLIISAGPWANSMLKDLEIPLQILRKHLHWFAPGAPCYQESNGFPCFFMESQEGYFYGFPSIHPHGLKVSEHTRGTEISDPLKDDRQPETEDDARIREFKKQHLPRVSAERTRHEVCHYTMTKTGNFVVDWYPEAPQVTFAAGLSGHGFKFTSALGETLVDMAVDRQTRHKLDFLSLAQPGLF